MSKQIKNLSSLIQSYNLQLIDLINYSCVEPSKESVTILLKDILSTLYSNIKHRRTDIPIHTQIYSAALKHILNNEGILVKKGPSIKELQIKQAIELSPPPKISFKEVKGALKEIDIADRVILCLFYRHRLTLEEISSLLSTSVGTIISKMSKAKEQIGQYVLRQIRVEQAIDISDNFKSSSECFFIKNLQSRYESRLITAEDSVMIEKHIKNCRLCKNYYAWQKEIEAALAEGEISQYDIVTEIDIVKSIDAKEKIKKIFTSFRINWKFRTSAFGVLLIITIISGLMLRDRILSLREELSLNQEPLSQKLVDEVPTPVAAVVASMPAKDPVPAPVPVPAPSIRQNLPVFTVETAKPEEAKKPATEPVVQAPVVASANPPKDEAEEATPIKETDVSTESGEHVVYKLVAHTDAWQELDIKIKNLLKLNNAQKAGQLEFGAQTNGGSYYHFTVSNNDFEQLIDRVKELATFQIIKQKETREIIKDRTRCVIWIGRTKQQ